MEKVITLQLWMPCLFVVYVLTNSMLILVAGCKRSSGREVQDWKEQMVLFQASVLGNISCRVNLPCYWNYMVWNILGSINAIFTSAWVLALLIYMLWMVLICLLIVDSSGGTKRYCEPHLIGSKLSESCTTGDTCVYAALLNTINACVCSYPPCVNGCLMFNCLMRCMSIIYKLTKVYSNDTWHDYA